MQVEIIHENQITDYLDNEIRDLLCLCFPKDRGVFSRTRYWNQTVPEYSVIIRKDSTLLAHLAVINRPILIGTESYRVAGIGNVCVHPSGRGRGVSRILLSKAMEEATAQAFDVGFLFCKAEIQNIYANLGWIAVNAPDIIRIGPGGTDESFSAWKNDDMAMYYPLTKKSLPPGAIHLQGINW